VPIVRNVKLTNLTDVYANQGNKTIFVIRCSTKPGLVDIINPQFILRTKRANTDLEVAYVFLPNERCAELCCDSFADTPSSDFLTLSHYFGDVTGAAHAVGDGIIFGVETLRLLPSSTGRPSTEAELSIPLGTAIPVGKVTIFQCEIIGKYQAPSEIQRLQHECRREQPFANAQHEWFALAGRKCAELFKELENEQSMNIGIFGAMGIGKSSLLNEIIGVIMGVFTTIEETGNCGRQSTTREYTRRQIMKMVMHTMEGFDPSQPQKDIALYKARVAAVIEGRLKDKSGLAEKPKLSDPKLLDYKLDAAILVLGPESFTERTMEIYKSIHTQLKNSNVRIKIVLNQCDNISDKSSGYQDPLEIVASQKVSQRVLEVRNSLGVGTYDVVPMMCPMQASTNLDTKLYYNLIIIDMILNLVQQRTAFNTIIKA